MKKPIFFIGGIVLGGILILVFLLYSILPHERKEGVFKESECRIEQLEPDQYQSIVDQMEDIYTNDDCFIKKSQALSERIPSNLLEMDRNGVKIAYIPGLDKKVAVYSKANDYQRGFLPTNGMILADDLTEVLENFELTGYRYEHVDEIGMPTEGILVVEAYAPPPGTVVILQYDFKSKTFENLLAETEVPFTSSLDVFPFSKVRGVVIYKSGYYIPKFLVSAPKERTIRLYSSEYPAGLEIVKIKYPKGKIIKYFWEDENKFYFLARYYKNSKVTEKLWRIDLN